MSRYIDVEQAEDYFANHRRYAIHRDDIVAYLESIPTADVEKTRHGEWIENEDDFWVICSACKYEIYDDLDERKSKYCPHCGAKMDGGDEQND